MVILCVILTLACLGLLMFTLFINKKLEQRVAHHAAEADRLRQYYECETSRIQTEANAALANAQVLLDQQLAEMKQDVERAREHYQAEARSARAEAQALVQSTLEEVEPLRKYQSLRDPEAQAARMLSEALEESQALRKEAQSLFESARTAAAQQRAQALEKAKELRQRAEALLTQATRDAGRIVADAEKRAEQIGGDAYAALRDKQTLEQAVQALWNTTEGYGDRYVFPSRSLLDELAADFGHTEAGEALRAAREHSRRMVEEKQASACNYAEADRRDRANRFVVDAFNGRVDAILSRTKRDNYGTLAQEIRDAYSLVNLNGLAFRDSRILPAYLEARLAELKWATVVQELKEQERAEQQRIREQMREEEKARRGCRACHLRSCGGRGVASQGHGKSPATDSTGHRRTKNQVRAAAPNLTAKLKEAEEKNQRAISMAQQTRRGHVYIISNIGSFGENVFKIGLTRRLIPKDRIDELGDSSVPFEFDIHALIFSEDAPALETQLHKHFVLNQVNKVNHRKEFFRVDLAHIRKEIEQLGLTTTWTMAAAAEDYRDTLAIEAKIKDNPELRRAWIKRQLELELPTDEAPIPTRAASSPLTPEMATTAPTASTRN